MDQELDHIKACYDYLNCQNSVYFLSPNAKEYFRKALHDIENSVENISKDIIMEKFEFENIEIGLNFLLDLRYETVRDDAFYKFIRDYVFLAFNVNNNTIKHSVIYDKCSQLLRYIDNSLTFDETLVLFKSTSNNLTNWKNYLPPIFRLSNHYYNIIREEN